MLTDRNIYYNNQQISCFNDLLKLFFSATSHLEDDLNAKLSIEETSNPILATLHTAESFLSLQNISKNTVLGTPYSYSEMIRVQNSLDILNTLESIKYMDNIINARSLLHKYLYSQYDISSCNIIAQTSDAFWNTRIIKKFALEDNAKYQYGNNILKLLDEINNTSPSKSIRNHITNFLKEKISSPTSSTIAYRLFIGKHSRKATDSDIAKTRLFLPAHQSLPFLLSFTYYDGRDFLENGFPKNKDNLPIFKQENSASEFSYKLVLNQIRKLFGQSTSNLDILMINSMSLCDKIFLYKKLNFLYFYYKKYTSDSFLNALVQGFNFTYNEIFELKNTLIELIFSDDKFMSKGLQSNYLDFMVLFDIFFIYKLILFSGYNFTRLTHLKEIIKNCKDMTNALLEHTSPFLLCPSNIVKKNDKFNIYETEMNILTSIQENPFFKKYYCSDNIFIEKYLDNCNAESSFPINFSIFKNAFRI